MALSQHVKDLFLGLLGGDRDRQNAVIASLERIPKVAYIKDIKPNGTNGGTTVDKTWTDRELNTLEDPSKIVKSLSNNHFTLVAGTYEIQAHHPLTGPNSSHKSRIRNLTDNVTSIVGTNEMSIGGLTDQLLQDMSRNGGPLLSDYTIDSENGGAWDAPLTRSHCQGIITITKDTTFSLQYWIWSGQINSGLGTFAGDGPAAGLPAGEAEVYSVIRIQKLDS